MLNLGCGHGHIATALSKSGWQVTSADDSEEAIKITKLRLSKNRLTQKLTTLTSNTLPFDTESFDGAVIVNFLEFRNDGLLLMKEISRILKPSGKAVFITVDWGSPWSISLIREVIRPGSRNKKFFPLSDEYFKFLTDATALKIEKMFGSVKYLPFQFGEKPLPWYKTNITISFCSKLVPLMIVPLKISNKRQKSDPQNMKHPQWYRIKVLEDNYIWLIEDKDTNTTIVVDPTLSEPVVEHLEKNDSETNPYPHHSPSLGSYQGVNELKSKYNPIIIGAKKDSEDYQALMCLLWRVI